MNEYLLSHGAHRRAEDGRCAMEWVSYLAGESHSDKPVCVSPMLQGFCIALNDALPDGQRQRMRPYLARTIGTAGDGLDDRRRWLCADWLIREYTPAWLELVPGLAVDAQRLRALPPILAAENVQRAMADLNAARVYAAAAGNAAVAAAWAAARNAGWAVARDAAGAAARNAAGNAAWAAARNAAGNAARDAAGNAARDAAWDAAWAAARNVARNAAWAAAGDAAGDAAGNALAPTVRALQDSVLDSGGLLDRMLPMVPVVLPVVAGWREVCGVGAAPGMPAWAAPVHREEGK